MRALEVGDDAGLGRLVRRLQRDVEYLLLLAAEGGEDAVARQLRERLGVGEVVGELRALGLLALPHLRDQPAALPHPLAQPADEVGVLPEPLDEDRAGALQRRGGVGDLLVDVAGGHRGGILGGIGEQRVGQRLQTRLARRHRLGAALGLVGQVDVLQAGLRLGGADLLLQHRIELALLADLLQDGAAPLLQLAQVAQALLQRAQLDVVERAGGLLAVAGDERHGGAAVEEVDGRVDLVGPDAELVGDALLDGVLRAGRRAHAIMLPVGTDSPRRGGGGRGPECRGLQQGHLDARWWREGGLAATSRSEDHRPSSSSTCRARSVVARCSVAR